MNMLIVSAATVIAVLSDDTLIASPEPGYTSNVLFARLFITRYTSPTVQSDNKGSLTPFALSAAVTITTAPLP